MKKSNRASVCFVISALLLLAFIFKTIIDYSRYSSTLNSAPFYVWIIANTVYFIIPSIIALVVGFVQHNSTELDAPKTKKP